MHISPMHSMLALVLGVVLAFAPEKDSVAGELAEGPVPAAAALAPVAPPASAEPAASPRDDADLMIDLALNALYTTVVEQSHPNALRYAFEAYYNFKSTNPGEVRKPYFYFVDFGLPSTEPRGYVFDMETLTVVDGPFTVAHGRGSASGAAPVPTRFSNRPGSNATSLGLFVAEETYRFSGKSGGRSYRSVGLRMDGVSGSFNSAARRRGVVVHGAPYVTAQKAGRSEGCPAMEPERAQHLLPMLSGGSLVFLFSPKDREWMRLEPWVDDQLALMAPRAPEIVSLR